MALLEIEDLEVASNQEIAVEDHAYYQWYIDAVTAYLEENYPNIIYSAEEDIYCDSGPAGLIELPGLIEFSDVELLDRATDTYYPIPRAYYSFDGVDKIYNLCTHATYKITVTYGFEDPPASVVAAATQLVLAGSGLDPNAVGGLTEYQVGNITEKYGVMVGVDGEPVVTLSTLQTRALARYKSTNTTWRT